MNCTLKRKPRPVFSNDNRTPLECKLDVNRLASCLPKYVAKSRRNKTPTTYPLRRGLLFPDVIDVSQIAENVVNVLFLVAVFSSLWVALVLLTETPAVAL